MPANINFEIALAPSDRQTGLELEVQSVSDFLRIKPHQTLTDIQDWTGLSRQQVTDVLRLLAKDECLGRVANKFYLIG